MTILETILQALASSTVEGTTGLDLEAQATSLIALYRVEPAFLGYQPVGLQSKYPNVLCISINGEVIHGIPDDRKFQDGDVIKIDCGIKYPDGQYDDGATTVVIGRGSAAARRLVKATREALDAGIAAAKPGATTNDIAEAIEAVAKKYEVAVVHGYGGHGIGTELHMAPFIPNEIVPVRKSTFEGEVWLVVDSIPNKPLEPEYEIPEGVVLVEGQRIAIEPMFATVRGFTEVDKNGWTVKVVGGGVAAHFERTVTI